MLTVYKNGVYVGHKRYKNDIPYKEFETIEIRDLPLPFDLSDLKATELHILSDKFGNLDDPFLPRNVEKVCIQQARRIKPFTGTPWVHVRHVVYLMNRPFKDMTSWFPNMTDYTGYSVNIVQGLQYYRIVDDDYSHAEITKLCVQNPKAVIYIASLLHHRKVEVATWLFQKHPYLRGES